MERTFACGFRHGFVPENGWDAGNDDASGSIRDLRFLLVGTTLICRKAFWASAPKYQFRFIDFVAHLLVGCEAGSLSGRAIYVDRFTTFATNQVVMIVANPIFVKCWGASGFDSSNDALVDQNT
jgi:hypothetical protein